MSSLGRAGDYYFACTEDQFNQVFQDLQQYKGKESELALKLENDILVPVLNEKQVQESENSDITFKGLPREVLVGYMLIFFEKNAHYLTQNKHLELLRNLRKDLSNDNKEYKKRFTLLKESTIGNIRLEVERCKADHEGDFLLAEAEKTKSEIIRLAKKTANDIFKQTEKSLQEKILTTNDELSILEKKIQEAKLAIIYLEETLQIKEELRESFCDTIIHCSDEKILTHSYLLKNIPFFRGAIDSPLENTPLTDEEKKAYPFVKRAFNFKDYFVNTVQQLLWYLNKEKSQAKADLEKKDLDDILLLYKLSDFLGLTDLTADTTAILFKRLSAEESLNALFFLLDFPIEDQVVQHCISKIVTSRLKLADNDTYLKLSDEVKKEIIKQQTTIDEKSPIKENQKAEQSLKIRAHSGAYVEVLSPSECFEKIGVRPGQRMTRKGERAIVVGYDRYGQFWYYLPDKGQRAYSCNGIKCYNDLEWMDFKLTND